jgi:hypothetical protein
MPGVIIPVKSLRAIVVLAGLATPIRIASAEATRGVLLVPDVSQWCGRRAVLSFSVVNSGSSEIRLTIPPSSLDPDSGTRTWAGEYQLMVGRYGSSRSIGECSATHGGTCWPQTETMILGPGARTSWHIRNVKIQPAKRVQSASLTIKVTVNFPQEEIAEVHRLSWAGAIRISKRASEKTLSGMGAGS